MYVNTEIDTVAKCIIAGEHAVLRAHPAIAYPLTQYILHLTYQVNSEPVTVNLINQPSPIIADLFWDTLDHALSQLQTDRSQLTGTFTVNNTIPIGVNLGGSAALCVAISKWCLAQGWIHLTELSDFAKKLEHRFHGKSSGIDIAVVAAEKPIYFENGKIMQLNPLWQPNWYVSNCDAQGLTKQCVDKVNQFCQSDPEQANITDHAMHDSVNMIKEALLSRQSNRLTQLTTAIKQAANCFAQWDLIQPTLAKHIDDLYQHGAIAVKPTGAGSGGHVLSLWETNPPDQIQPILLPLSNK